MFRGLPFLGGGFLAEAAARFLAKLGDTTPVQHRAPSPPRYRGRHHVEHRRPVAGHSWSAFQALVQRMSHRERKAWARTGYAGLGRSNGDVKKLQKHIDAYREFRRALPGAPVGAFVLAQVEAAGSGKPAGARS